MRLAYFFLVIKLLDTQQNIKAIKKKKNLKQVKTIQE